MGGVVGNKQALLCATLLLRWAITSSRSLLAVLYCMTLLACSKPEVFDGQLNKQESLTPQATVSTFACAAPQVLEKHVSQLLLDASVASESTDPWQGTFMANALRLQLRNGSEISVSLEEPLYLLAKSQFLHNACEQFTFRKFGPYYVFDYLYGTGNPYPPQQLSYTTDSFGEFKPLTDLHPLMDQGFMEFEKNDCVTSKLKGDGVVNRLCLQGADVVLTAILLEKSFQEESHHAFLCDVSKEAAKVIEYSFKPYNSNVQEYEPQENRAKMLEACMQYRASMPKTVSLDGSIH